MKPLHITRTVFDVTVCEIRGVRLRVPLRAGASACTSEWHSSAPSTTTTLPRAVSLSPGSLVVHDHPSAPVIRWFQTVALTSRCGSFWKVLFGVMWETGTWGRVSVGRCVCVCVCVHHREYCQHVLPFPDCLLSLKRARRLPTSASQVPCSDPPAKTDQIERLPATDASGSLLFHYWLRLPRTMDQLWTYLAQPSSGTHFRQAERF